MTGAHNPDVNPDWKPLVAYRIYACTACGAETRINTNHTGKCRRIVNPHTARERVYPADTCHAFVRNYQS